jgi:hypothetical protein
MSGRGLEALFSLNGGPLHAVLGSPLRTRNSRPLGGGRAAAEAACNSLRFDRLLMVAARLPLADSDRVSAAGLSSVALRKTPFAERNTTNGDTTQTLQTGRRRCAEKMVWLRFRG